MFQTIIDYFKDNINLVYVSAIVFSCCLAIGIIIIFARKAVRKKRDNNTITAQPLTEPVKTKTTDIAISADGQPAEKISAPEKETKEETKQKPEVEIKEEEKQLQAITEKSYEEELKYKGKWLIKINRTRFSAELLASNAVVMLRTESYSALSGIKSGIETIKNNIEKNNFAISVDRSGNFFFKVFSSATRLLCVSEAYSSKAACERAIESVKRFAKTAVTEIEEKQEQTE